MSTGQFSAQFPYACMCFLTCVEANTLICVVGSFQHVLCAVFDMCYVQLLACVLSSC